MKIRNLNPIQIKIPQVRVTSYFDAETLELFKHSIREIGIQQPILCAFDGENYWVIDGKNRLEEARLNGMKTIPVAIVEADMKRILLKNLTINTLRGKVKPTEMLRVVHALVEEHGLSTDEVAQQSGLRRDYIEKLLSIAKCHEKVVAALDENLISVSHAYEISRVGDEGVQERLLGQVLSYRVNVRDLKDIVDETLRILAERERKTEARSPAAEVKIPTVKCNFCEQDWPLRRVAGFNLCISCYAIANEAIKQKLDEIRIQAQAERERQRAKLAEAATTPREG